MLQPIRAEEADEKNVVIWLVSMFSSWAMVHKLSKKVHFLQFCSDLSEKSKSVNAIYICSFESCHYTTKFTGVRATVHEILAIKISKKMLAQQKFNKIIFKFVSHCIINSTISWKWVRIPFRCIYVNCFHRLRSFVEVITKLRKMHFFRQIKDHNSGRENRN